MSSSVQNIFVAVRIRPDERVKNPCVTSTGRTVQLSAPTTQQLEDIRKRNDFYQSRILTRAQNFKNKRNSFKYDHVYSKDTSQETIYDQLGSVALKNCMDGYNSTLFCYGQTGSGKTFTLFGPSLSCPEETKGIIPRLCDDIFTAISIKNKEESKRSDFNVFIEEPSRQEEVEGEEAEENEPRHPHPPPKSPSQGIRKSKYTVLCSMIEIYNEKIRDLLVTKSADTKKNSTSACPRTKTDGGLELREHPKRGWFIPDLTLHETKSSEEIQKLLLRGSKNRTIAQTKMNDRSSRAHTIFQIRITRTETFYNRSGKKNLYTSDSTSLVNLVDLAGSEQMSTAVGSNLDSTSIGIPDRQKRKEELISINISLSCLGMVITKLAKRESGDRSIQHIPYRNSKLTRILEDSLGGTAKTIMIATLSPHPYHFEQTLSTCRYADRVKSIKNRVVVHMDPKEKIIKELRKKIKHLQKHRNSKNQNSKKSIEEIEDLKTLNENISRELELMTRKHEREKEMHFTSNSYLRHQNKMLKQKLEECYRNEKDRRRKLIEKTELIEFLRLENEQINKLKRKKMNELKKQNRSLQVENRSLKSDLEKFSEELNQRLEREIEQLNERHHNEIKNFSKLLSLSKNKRGEGGEQSEEGSGVESWREMYFKMKKKVEVLQQKIEMKSLIEKNEIREKQDQITEGLSKINMDMIYLEKTISNIWNGGGNEKKKKNLEQEEEEEEEEEECVSHSDHEDEVDEEDAYLE